MLDLQLDPDGAKIKAAHGHIPKMVTSGNDGRPLGFTGRTVVISNPKGNLHRIHAPVVNHEKSVDSPKEMTGADRNETGSTCRGTVEKHAETRQEDRYGADP